MGWGHAFDAAERLKLHRDGFLELPRGLPEWDVFSDLERCYAKYRGRVERLLEESRPTWGDDGGDERPGTNAAWEVSQVLREAAGAKGRAKGMWVSAVHPAVSDTTEERTGPRFYVSIMEAAQKKGPASMPPSELVELLWPDQEDRVAPWITEIGWTMTPPGCDPQVIHADICSWEESPPNGRCPNLGRFHHILWKPDHKALCTTKIVAGAFTEGHVMDEHYGALVQVRSPALVVDSECLHGGARTGPEGWTSTLTLQLSSTRGWDALRTGGRASDTLLGYTLPIGGGASGLVAASPAGAARSPSPRSETSASKCREGLPKDTDVRGSRSDVAGGSWRKGDAVEVEFHGEWHPAVVARQRPDGTYKVSWVGEDTFTDAVPGGRVRPRAPGPRPPPTEGAAPARPKKRARTAEETAPGPAPVPQPVC